MNRKSFIRSLVGGAGAVALPLGGKIQAATTHLPNPVALPRVKITAVRPYVFRKATFVRIDTDAGVSGWGEADHDLPKLTAAVVEELCAPNCIGKNPFESNAIWHKTWFKGEDAGSTGLLPGALAGVDNALWDLKGRLLGLPVHQLLGGNGLDRVRCYGSFGRSGGKNGLKTPTEMAATAAAFVAEGYKTVKARMQIRQINVDPDPDETFAIVREVRRAIGDDIELFVDFNNGYTPAKAIDMALRLYEAFGIAAVEEPVSQFNYPGLAQVVAAVPVSVMAGEHEFNKWQVRDLIVTGQVDTINADVIKCAGISECLKVAHLAYAFDRPIMAHNARPTLACAASLQLLAAIPNAARVQEYGGSRPELGLNELFQNPIVAKDGYLEIPKTPGLGLEPDLERMERMREN
ncbi:mandelate racemase/muconate lactonizing enzyme family protein [Neolewinella lacunae]|uniref:Mandelate racemase/muconate lactonizing enzyme family protein n=1 Tax=Neolewinella lacunae TaxID=1517758 RepID=A0A923PJC7_9BACT|nr:mandelate racemase/muconate lactonizing enzyme family protein [Neolewinella lacunae]MBC6995213.1 mandelate racemase/muconate lactonizing enzyme family protein [Neolewinella lacunae]MDN3635478.1 mandelate racemase/muconate lactonizing enzyme family protein [Neolewinella lacunae]